MSDIIFVERHAAGPAEGLLVLHHGRGSNEQDLIGLADVFDPTQRLHVVSPRAPLTLEGWQGHHWYMVPRVGHPDPASFSASYGALSRFHETLWESTGLSPQQTILGGFSMGTVMSYATGLGAGRPAPAGILAISGFIPTVEGWQPEFATRADTKVFIAHGSPDPVISDDFARKANELIGQTEMDLEYHESEAGHNIDPRQVPLMVDWINRTLPHPSSD
ncbi:MAG: phospholipase [Solirubrobacterales bacterium]|nr:phospholipase [Solirubrobacterales bacterium]